ncbi:MAG TPA: glycosyltransferase [Acidimicrobiales bacterium]|nr:glycosyltransferase [Acidimicrobiales bacterium]
MLTWGALLGARGRWWAADLGLPQPPYPDEGEGSDQGPGTHQRDSAGDQAPWPQVAIVVPAHNEASLVRTTLTSLLAQSYPGGARVFFVDDASTDATGDIARQMSAELHPGHPVRLQVVSGAPRPSGWAGKPWAMHQGFCAALEQEPGWHPQYVLFTDADIVHEPLSLRRLVHAALAHHLGAVSLMAKLSCTSPWERLLVPAFVYFFAQLYPFARVNDRAAKTAAAAGGCLLVDTATLLGAGGIKAIQGRTIDDVSLARALKRSGAPIWLGLAGGPAAPEVDSIRYYPSLSSLWEMVARNAYTQLRHQPLLLVGTLGAMANTYLGPPALLVWGVAKRRPSYAISGALAWSAMAATYAPMLRYYGRRRLEAFALPLTAALYAAMTATSAWRHYQRHRR